MVTGTSILLMLAGTLLPVLAAAPFYLRDHRARQQTRLARPDQEP